MTDRPTSCLVWLGKEPLTPGRNFLLKLGTSTAVATVEPAISVLDLDTRVRAPTEQLFMNDIGRAVLRLDREVATDRYVDCKETAASS